jgi:hypothetical protein
VGAAERVSVGLVACAATKAATPQPARSLYRSELFRRASAYAERTYDHWFILSARHYLVHPGEILAPYDQTLKGMRRDEVDHWASVVECDLRCGHGAMTEGRTWPVVTPKLLLGDWIMARPRRRVDLWFHAGAAYTAPLTARIAVLNVPYDVHTPLAGLGIGRQLAWYATRADPQTVLFDAPDLRLSW